MFNKRLTFLVISILLLAHRIGTVKKKNGKKRMYGAKDATDGQVPYAAFHILRNAVGYKTCSGSILTLRWVLTAAHCLNGSLNPRSHLVVAGKANLNPYLSRRYRMNFYTDINERQFDLQERRAAQVFFHPNYTRAGNNDVGLVYLQRPFIENDKVSLVPLSRLPMEAEPLCTLAGYGIVEGNQRRHILQYMDDMPARQAADCRYNRHKDLICLADTSRGICQGDSGGPIVCRGTQRGVASHALVRGGGLCGVGVIEQYYTDTQRNLIWIDTVMQTTLNTQ